MLNVCKLGRARTRPDSLRDYCQPSAPHLHDNGGHCNLGDKSPAELIADTFKVSKKTFKKAVGDLYRRKLITIADDGITLV